MDNTISDTSLDLAYGVWGKDDMMMLDDADLEANFLHKYVDIEFDILHISETDPDPMYLFSVDEIRLTQQLEAKPTARINETLPIPAPRNSRTEKMETSECAQIKPHQNSFPYQINEPQNTTYDSAEFRAKYNRALSNLALSMQKSEMSRTQIIYQRQNQAHECNNVNRINTSSLPELSLVY
mmetsp:Transcript_7659/g.9577  ORF Transcript_7659/g.9577 Transcript_7659/m.9577 type:complete len:182 (+) Transcript_7659:286-831(+)